jgi:flavin reductase (DIM6/NTAB) family NADH-FMN oxidoreductase RutF
MEVSISDFYELMSPRCTVLISTIDGNGNTNAAPFSFVTPVSTDPPLLLFAAVPARHTLANARETGDFVINMVQEELLDKLWVCSKAFPKGTSEISEARLTERASRKVKSPSIQECYGWIECTLEFEKEAGNHVLVVGRVVSAECRDGYISDGEVDIPSARPVMHTGGNRFVVAERLVRPRT